MEDGSEAHRGLFLVLVLNLKLCFRDQFPMDIVLGLDKLANVYKVVIDADEAFTRTFKSSL